MDRSSPWRLLAIAYALLLGGAVCSLPVAKAAGEPGPGICHKDCTKYGNCGDDGQCRCPFGRLGEGCEIDFLAPCRQSPDTLPYCGVGTIKSCECMRRCRQYFCRTASDNATSCEYYHPPGNRGCYEREGVEPDKQYSLVPEEKETGVKFFTGDGPDAEPVNNRSQALLAGGQIAVPLSECPDSCNKRGYCFKWADNPTMVPFCSCHRGWQGHSCEADAHTCYLGCNGRGKCLDQFCHCEPPYFSIGCSRSKVYPANHSVPSPVNFKIYMYELNTQVAYENVPYAGWTQHDNNYIAYQKFLEQFLLSPVRTEDPSEANLFYIPSFTYGYSGNTGTGQDHLNLLLDHVRMKWPYWNRTQGRDHFVWASADRGACHLWGLAMEPIKLTHFGLHLTNETWNRMGGVIWGHLSNKERYGCFHPLRDVLTVPFDGRVPMLNENAHNMTVDELIAGKKSLFFFAGGIRKGDMEYAGSTRHHLHTLAEEWKDSEFGFLDGPVGNYEERLRTSKFCLAPYGFGYGMRLHQAIITGCVPVIIQENVYQPFEEILPYEAFSLRLNNGDLPRLREILRGVSDEQYRQLLERVQRYRKAFFWDTDLGGQAFEYTIAALRRRHLNLKALYY